MEQGKNLEVINVEWLDRWQVYYRLQDLGIECYCRLDEPLRACIDSPQVAAQIWSVSRRVVAKRQELVAWLESCWQIQLYK